MSPWNPTCACVLGSLGIVAALTHATAPAMAEERACGKRDALIGTLSQSYQEKPIAIGLSQDGSLVELLSTVDGSTWTILVTMPSGTSCIATAGQDWQPLISSAMVPAGLRL